MNATVSNLPAKVEKRSILVDMATRFGMEPQAFADTICATVFPKEGTNEEFLAFLLVAKEYNLNPLTKEIYAFPKKGGGIQPIVSIDGWCNLINSHPQLNGIEFDDHIEGDKVTAITARLWRKDREKPIVVTEYLTECVRSTDPWKQYPRRMLRHKALIQCARYAFGFAGIVDPDEAERMGADVSPMRDVSQRRDDGPPAPAAVRTIEHKAQVAMPAADPREVELVAGETMDHETGEVTWSEPPAGDGIPDFLDRRAPPTAPADGEKVDEKAWINDVMGAFSGCEDMVSFGTKQREVMAAKKGMVSAEAWKMAQRLSEETFKRIQDAA